MSATTSGQMAALVSILLVPVGAAGGPMLPKPQEVVLQGAPIPVVPTVRMTGNTDDAEMSFLRGYVGGLLAAAGYPTVDEDAGVDIHFHRFGGGAPPWELPDDVEPFAAMGEEGYMLAIEGEDPSAVRITVAAGTPHGLFNGGMTLLGLLLDADGAAEPEVAPQRIRDYPDHPKRGGYLYSVKLPHVDGSYVFSEGALARLDELARMKVNTLFLPQSLATTEATWNMAKDALAQLRDACRERFIEPRKPAPTRPEKPTCTRTP